MIKEVGMFPRTTTNKKSVKAAHDLLRELEANDSLTDDMRKILAAMEIKLSENLTLEGETSESVETQSGTRKILGNIKLSKNFTLEGETSEYMETPSKEDDMDKVIEKLNSAKEKIKDWTLNLSMICESGPEVASEFIEAVQEVLSLLDRLRNMGQEENEVNENISQAEVVLQDAMARLEEEMVYILVQKRQSYEPYTAEDDGSEGDDTSAVNEPDEINFDLIDPESITFLISIKNTMFSAGYHEQFCAAYTKTQKEALEECLVSLGMEKHSMDELLKMEWSILDSKIKTWFRVIKTAIQVYLKAEKRLCSQIFGVSSHLAFLCFVNTTKSSISRLLIIGNAMSLGRHTPEKLFSLLDMYEALAKVHEEINTLFSDDDGSIVRAEFEEVMSKLGVSAKETFLGFGETILSDPSIDPFPGGGVHPLTSYVMNFIIVYLPDYCGTLDTLLQEKGKEDNMLGSHLRSLGDKLITNLEKKSLLYKDVALQNVFMMNNLHYLQHKVMGSELRGRIGDGWIRTQIVNYQKNATSYVRNTWGSVVAGLRDDGTASGSGSGVKAILKEKIRVFNVAFEDVYRNQTGWIIREEQLKDELKISISQKVILAYQSFLGRNARYNIQKYVKYESEDLEKLLQDFFEGSQKTVQYSFRRR
ncbi:exocyst complex component EXO70E2-like [Silene latifolia]|uniref:exocyst complex component EXO70E2-like n=1 Tax=Silene latifolia TaxID=37657 RepID=UPI003D7729A1